MIIIAIGIAVGLAIGVPATVAVVMAMRSQRLPDPEPNQLPVGERPRTQSASNLFSDMHLFSTEEIADRISEATPARRRAKPTSVSLCSIPSMDMHKTARTEIAMGDFYQALKRLEKLAK